MSDDFSDIPEVVDSLAGPATLKRMTRVLGSDGFWHDGAAEAIAISVVSWPTTGREAQQLPEGVRTRELRTFATTTELFGVIPGTGRPADRIEGYLGADWDVQRCSPWNVGAYWVAVAARVGQ